MGEQVSEFEKKFSKPPELSNKDDLFPKIEDTEILKWKARKEGALWAFKQILGKLTNTDILTAYGEIEQEVIQLEKL